MTRMVHSSTGGFVRQFTAGVGTNRLLSIAVGKTRYDYTTDANGNVTGETSSRHYSWSHSDRLVVFATQTPGAEPSVHAQYLYDAAGERVKKLVRRQGGAIEVTHYLGSAFEHHRWSGVRGGENNHLHLMDDRRRIALVRVGAVHPDDRGPAVAVHLADHLGSSTIVLDGAGVVVNREEYTPYGESSFGSYARKRYRFIGRERDESSLVVTSARYYAPWTTRWTSCEPQGGLGHPASPPTAENLNSYWYAQANPLRLVDPDGRSPAGGVDLTQKVPPVLGSDAHRDILPVLQARLIFIGFDTQVDNSGLAADLKRNGILTAPGGSLSGKSRGETDLVIRTLEDQRVVGDLYELKPGRLTDSSRTARQVAKQVKFGQRLLFAGNPLFYRAGTVLERLTPLQQADVFAPIIVEKGTIVRTYSVGLGTDEHGKVVPGTIGYSFADVKHPRQEGADARASAEDHLRTPIIQRAPVEHDEDADNDSHDDVDDDDYRPPMTPEQHQQAARNTAGVLTVGAVLLFVARLAILAL